MWGKWSWDWGDSDLGFGGRRTPGTIERTPLAGGKEWQTKPPRSLFQYHWKRESDRHGGGQSFDAGFGVLRRGKLHQRSIGLVQIQVDVLDLQIGKEGIIGVQDFTHLLYRALLPDIGF